LKPNTDYYFRITLDRSLESLNPTGLDHVTADSVAIAFRTAATAAAPAVYYVAPDGDDADNGRSRDRAWRTVSRAADRVRPGDTVLIAGGTFTETVRVRATGDRNRPITFKAMPGEKVIFDGDGRTLGCAFYATDKAHLHFDGFYFTRFMHGSPSMPWSDRAGGHNGAIVLYRSDNVQITRCFHDSRGPGYGPGLVHARHCADLLLQNNVIIGSMGGGVSFAGCPGARIENNVFLRNLISHVSEAVNEPQQKFLMANNIFTDSIPSKVRGSLFAIGKIESLVERNNCYYLRVPNEERRMFVFYEPQPAYERAALSYRLRTEFPEPPVITERTRLTLTEHQQRFNPDSGSVVADPLFKGTLDMERVGQDGKPIYLGDRLSGRSDLDFPDLFTTHPELIERRIGLQPEAFKDFHFAGVEKGRP